MKDKEVIRLQPIDNITQEERDAIIDYIEEYAEVGGDQCAVKCGVEDILQFWNKNKVSLYTLFGNKLIIDRQIDIDRPKVLLKGELEALLDNNNFIENLYKIFNWLNLQDYNRYCGIFDLINHQSLLNNEYYGTEIDIETPGGKVIQVRKGCKTIRVLGKIAKAFNLEDFETFRIAHSMVLNRKKLKGTLTLSIHPLDYMTMSDNDCDWESCMSWRYCGEYRMGTVECMNSPYIVVAYLRRYEDMQISRTMHWSNKRWRELFIVTPDVISGIRGYPFEDQGLEKFVLEWLQELSNSQGLNFLDHTISYRNGQVNEWIAKTINFSFNIMYNDLFYNDYHPAYFSQNFLSTDKDCYLNLSGETQCMCCGQQITNWQHVEGEALLCPECSGMWRCLECGEYMPYDECIILANGERMCGDCVDRYASRCSCCGEYFRTHHTTRIFPVHQNKLLMYDSARFCDECLKEDFIKECGDIKFEAIDGYARDTVNTKNFTNRGYEMFGFWSADIETMKKENKRSRWFNLF